MIRRNEQEPEPDIPGWVTTYSDMVTLLMTFFVLLQSMANVQDAGLVGKGRDSFVKHIKTYGLGILMGWSPYSGLGQDKLRHRTEADEPNALRTVDSDRELRRRAFSRIQQAMTTLGSAFPDRRTEVMMVNVGFPQGSARLDGSSLKRLEEFALDLRLVVRPSDQVYVLGIGDSSMAERDQWLLSAARAREVAQFLRQRWQGQGERQAPRVYAWGAGSGAGWAGQETGQQAQVLVAVIKPDS